MDPQCGPVSAVLCSERCQQQGPASWRTSLRLKRKQESEQRSTPQHALERSTRHSHRTALCRRPHQTHAWLASHDCFPAAQYGIELRRCCVATSAQRFWAPLGECSAYSAVLVPPVHPILYAGNRPGRACVHTEKGEPFSSAGKHKPVAVSDKAAHDSNSPLVIPRQPGEVLGGENNADMNAQQPSVSFGAALLVFPAAVQACKGQVACRIHQKESDSYLPALLSARVFAIAHGQRTCQAQAPVAGREQCLHHLVLRSLTSHSPRNVSHGKLLLRFLPAAAALYMQSLRMLP